MEFLRKLLGVARQARAVIDDMADASSGSANASASASAAGQSAGSASRGFEAHIANGCADPRVLLTRSDAAEVLGAPVSDEGSTGWDEEWLSVEYHADNDPTHRVRLDVSAGMPWDYIATEVANTPVEGIGDQALRDGNTLYVRRGEVIFWVQGDRVSGDAINDVARNALGRL